MPTADELKALLDAEIRNGSELTIVDLVHWEALKSRLHLTPTAAEFGRDQEMNYRGLKIRRSAAG